MCGAISHSSPASSMFLLPTVENPKSMHFGWRPILTYFLKIEKIILKLKRGTQTQREFYHKYIFSHEEER
jgi:hypothetical protein